MNKKLLISLAVLVLIIGVVGYTTNSTGLMGRFSDSNSATNPARGDTRPTGAAANPFLNETRTATPDVTVPLFITPLLGNNLNLAGLALTMAEPSKPATDAAFTKFAKGDKILYRGDDDTKIWYPGTVQGKDADGTYTVTHTGDNEVVTGRQAAWLAQTTIHPAFSSLKVGDLVVVKSGSAYYAAKVDALNKTAKTIAFKKVGSTSTLTTGKDISPFNVYVPGGIVEAIAVGNVGLPPEITDITAVMTLDGSGNNSGAFNVLPAQNPNKDNSYLTDGKGKYYFNYQWKIAKEGLTDPVWDKGWNTVINGDDDKPLVPSLCYNNPDIYDVRNPGVKLENIYTCSSFTLSKEAGQKLVTAGQGKYAVKVDLGNGDAASTKTVSTTVYEGNGYVLSQLKYAVVPTYDLKTGNVELSIEVDSSQLDTVPWQNGGVINVKAHTGETTTNNGVNINMLFHKTGDFNGMPTGEVCMSKTLNAYAAPCVQKLIIPAYNENGKLVVAAYGSADTVITVESKFVANITGSVSQQFHFKNNGKSHLRIEPIFGKNADNTDKVGFGYSYCNAGCGSQVFTGPAGNDNIATAYQVVKIYNDALNNPADPDGMIPESMVEDYVIQLDGEYVTAKSSGGVATADPLLKISGGDIAKYGVAYYDYTLKMQVPAPTNFPAPGKSITLYIPTTAMTKNIDYGQSNSTGYGKPNMLSIWRKGVSTPLALYKK